MMKRLQLLVGLLSLTCLSYAQKENNFWAMGYGVGLDFNSGTAVAVKTGMNAERGGAAVSDPYTGKLLFYSDGDTVWNANHVKMPNGSALKGNWVNSGGIRRFNPTAQGVAIVPFIKDPNKYYLFSMEQGRSGPVPGDKRMYLL